jgi:hypothetical protein
MGSLRVLLGFWPTLSSEFRTSTALGLVELTEFVLGTHDDLAIFVETADDEFTVFAVTVRTDRFLETPMATLDAKKLQFVRTRLTFLSLSVTAEEHERILQTCRACVQAKLSYNDRDMLLLSVPFRTPDEKGLFEVKQVHNAQAAILILRECLDGDNPAFSVVRGVNSRNTSADRLYQALLEGGLMHAPTLH